MQTNWSHVLLDTRAAYTEASSREAVLEGKLDRLRGVADRVADKIYETERELRELQAALDHAARAAGRRGW